MYKTSLALLTLGLALAACGGGGYGYNTMNPPGYGTNCTPPANTVLVYPSNGATAVPDSTGAVYVALPNALGTPNNFDVALTGPPAYGTVLEGGFTPVSYASIPTPNTAPGYANPQYYESTLRASLTAATVFSVYWNNLGTACNSSTNASLIGKFTTQ